jgi:hypothetical protein
LARRDRYQRLGFRLPASLRQKNTVGLLAQAARQFYRMIIVKALTVVLKSIGCVRIVLEYGCGITGKTNQGVVDHGQFARMSIQSLCAPKRASTSVASVECIQHHYIPAGRHQHQSIAGTRFVEYLSLPVFPVDRIVSMQREVRRRVTCQLIRSRCRGADAADRQCERKDRQIVVLPY